MDDWPDCPVPGCPNKICLSLNSDRCFPHTKGNEHVKRWKIDARNAPAPDPLFVERYREMGEAIASGKTPWAFLA